MLRLPRRPRGRHCEQAAFLRHWVLDVKRSGKIFARWRWYGAEPESKLAVDALSRLQGSMRNRGSDRCRTAITASEYGPSGALVTAGVSASQSLGRAARVFTHNLKLQNIATDTHRGGRCWGVTAVCFTLILTDSSVCIPGPLWG